MMNKKRSIAVVEDLPEIYDFLISCINSDERFQCKNAYYNAEDALNFLPSSEIALAIVDIGLPKMTGIELVAKLRLQLPDMAIMMFTVFEDDDKIFESLKAGANGYMLKNTDCPNILNAVQELLDGGSPMSPSIARKVTEFFFNPAVGNSGLEQLTDKENQILSLLSQGLYYKEIATKMEIKVGTVKQRIHRIYKKIHVNNRTEAINKYLGR